MESKGITPDDIAKLRELCEKATPGPWEWWDGNPWHADAPNHPLRQGNPPTVFRTGDSSDGFFYKEGAKEQSKEDTKFIAASREWLPLLLDELERLEDAAVYTLPCGHHSSHERSVSGTQYVRGYPEDVDGDWCEVCDEQIEPYKQRIAELERLFAEEVEATSKRDKATGERIADLEKENQRLRWKKCPHCNYDPQKDY